MAEHCAAEIGALTALEQAFIRCVMSAQTFLLPDTDYEASQNVLRARVIRAVLFGLPIVLDRQTTEVVQVTAFGVRIGRADPEPPESKAAWNSAARVPITGTLDLAGLNIARDGTPPYLELRWCDFDSPIDISNAVVGRLSLEGSRFEALCLDDTVVAGPLDLRWCGPRANTIKAIEASAERTTDQCFFWPFSGELMAFDDAAKRATPADDAPLTTPNDSVLARCVVHARSVRLRGSAEFSCSDFCYEQGQKSAFRSNAREIKNALDLTDAEIGGSLYILQSVIAGGVALRGARISGDFWLKGTRLLAHGDEDALNLQNARVGGILGMTSCSDRDSRRLGFKRNYVNGPIHGIGLSAGHMWFGGGVFFSEFGFAQATIAHTVTFGAYAEDERDDNEWCLIRGSIFLVYATIGANLEVNYLNHNQPSDGISCLLVAYGARINKRVYISYSDLRNDLYEQANRRPREIASLNFFKATIGIGFRIGEHSNCYGPIMLNLARIEREVSVNCCIYGGGVGTARIPTALDLRDACIIGDLRIGGMRERRQELATPASTRSDQEHSQAASVPASDPATPVENQRADSCELEPVRFCGAVTLAGATIDGRVELQHACIDLSGLSLYENDDSTPDDFMEQRVALALNDVRISGALKISDVHWRAPGESFRADYLLKKALSRPGYAVDLSGLDFYEGIRLVEIRHHGRFRRVLWDRRADDIDNMLVSLDGTSAPIHVLNERLAKAKRFRLYQAASRKSYLVFFCDAIEGDQGAFRITRFNEQPDAHIHQTPQPDVEDTASSETVTGSWPFMVEIIYGKSRFQAELALSDDGSVEMVDDVPIESLDDAPRDHYPWRPIFDEKLAPLASLPFWIPLPRTQQREELDQLRAVLGADPHTAVVEPTAESAPGDNRVQDKVANFRSALAFCFKKIRNSGLYRKSQTGLVQIGATRWGRCIAHALRPLSRRSYRSLFASTTHVEPFTPGIVVNLNGLNCGLLDDDFGRQWSLEPYICLQAAGIRVNRVEPAAKAKERDTAQANRYDGRTSVKMQAGGESSAGDDQTISQSDSATEEFQSKESGQGARRGHHRDAATSRLTWLARQMRRRLSDDRSDRQRGLMRVAKWCHAYEDNVFVPQVYEEFATAHIRAGEVEEGYKLLAEKKDISHVIRVRRLFRWFWRYDDKPRQGEYEESKGLGPWGWPGPWLLIFATLIVIAAGFGMVPEHYGGVFRGAAVTCVVLSLFPLIDALVVLCFRLGFNYGLSTRSALATFSLCVLIGAVFIHIGRTGGLSPDVNWAQLTRHGLNKNVAIVLDVGYQPEAPASINKAGDDPDLFNGQTRVRGTTVYANATPCNLDVNDLLYALDTFLPLVDLDQERRCTIRPMEDGQDDAWWLWRFGKALYTVLGWVVTSLLILTISGVMRRDLER